MAFLLGAATLMLVSNRSPYSVASAASGGRIVLLAAGWSLAGAGALTLARAASPTIGVLLGAMAIAWYAEAWADPTAPALVFSLGLAGGAAALGVAGHIALAYPSGRLGSRIRRMLVVAGYLITLGLAGVLPALFYDPPAQGCFDCAINFWTIADQPSWMSGLIRLGLVAVVTWNGLVIVVIASRLHFASRAARGSFGYVALASGLFLVISVYSAGRALAGESVAWWSAEPQAWRYAGVAATAIGAAVIGDVIRRRRAHRALTAIIVGLGEVGVSGRLEQSLGRRVGDPQLTIAYPIDDGARYVDGLGRPVDLTADTRTRTVLRADGHELGVMLHRRDVLSGPADVTTLVAAIRLGLVNERLHAEALHQLTDLRSSGMRILAAGDEERRRLERDLHDGAQQRLVALAFATGRTRDATPEMAAAEAAIGRAITELRDLAHGLTPTTLGQSGLPAALAELGETCDLLVGAFAVGRLPDVTEMTVYLLVAAASAAGLTHVEAERSADALDVIVRIVGNPSVPKMVLDRIRTLGGTLDTDDHEGTTVLRLRLPTC